MKFDEKIKEILEDKKNKLSTWTFNVSVDKNDDDATILAKLILMARDENMALLDNQIEDLAIRSGLSKSKSRNIKRIFKKNKLGKILMTKQYASYKDIIEGYKEAKANNTVDKYKEKRKKDREKELNVLISSIKELLNN